MLQTKFLDVLKRTIDSILLRRAIYPVSLQLRVLGSEVTSFAVITDSETHIKYPLADCSGRILLSSTLLLVMSVPASVTANAGMDVFSRY